MLVLLFRKCALIGALIGVLFIVTSVDAQLAATDQSSHRIGGTEF